MSLLEIRDGGVILLCQRSRKIPRHHHPHVILLGLDRRNHLQVGRVEVVIQVVLHQHAYAKARYVGRVAGNPALDRYKQLGALPLKHLGRHLVAGCPVVHVWQEPLHRLQTRPIVAQLRDDESVELVLVEVGMRKVVQEVANVLALGQTLRQPAELRRAHANGRARINRGHELALEVPVCGILQTEELFPDGVGDHARTSPPAAKIILYPECSRDRPRGDRWTRHLASQRQQPASGVPRDACRRHDLLLIGDGELANV